jgi:hypothetical protein
VVGLKSISAGDCLKGASGNDKIKFCQISGWMGIALQKIQTIDEMIEEKLVVSTFGESIGVRFPINGKIKVPEEKDQVTAHETLIENSSPTPQYYCRAGHASNFIRLKD